MLETIGKVLLTIGTCGLIQSLLATAKETEKPWSQNDDIPEVTD